MSSSVTVLGSNKSSLSLTFDSESNYTLARQLADLINTSVSGGANYLSSFDTAPPPPVPAGFVGGFYQQQTNFSQMPADYVVNLVKTPGLAFVQSSGKADQIIMSDENTALTFVAAAGSGTVAAGGGPTHFFVASSVTGAWNLASGAANDIVQALGAGNDTINAGGGDNIIVLGGGSDFITAIGNDSIVANGGKETINAVGATSTAVVGGHSELFFVGGTGGATIYGGSGSDTYFGSGSVAGDQIVYGGSAGNNLLVAGNGPATLFGGGNKDQLYAVGSAGQSLRAAGGSETLSAAASTGNDTLVGGTGKTTMIGGFGTTTFEFIKEELGCDDKWDDKGKSDHKDDAGTNVVQGLTPFSDFTIHLTNYKPSEVDQALKTQKNYGGSTTISLSDGTKVTFENISHLSKSDFS